MCGAYVLFHQTALLEKRFRAVRAFDAGADAGAGAGAGAGVPNGYKLLPSESVALVLRPERGVGTSGAAGAPLLTTARWGLVPFWADTPDIGRRLTNARAEGLGGKPAFRGALASRRCLIPADGFYEWERPSRRPMYFRRADGATMALAGLWQEWRDPAAPGGAPPLRTCTIITTAANGVVGRVHDRMPAILRTAEDESRWLGGAPDQPLRSRDAEALAADLLQPYPDGGLEGYFVSRRINLRGEHGPDALAPAGDDGDTAPSPAPRRRASAPEASAAATLTLPL